MTGTWYRLGPGQAIAVCEEHSVIRLDQLTMEFLPRKRVAHFGCGGTVSIFKGPKTRLVIHAHHCGHAIGIPYREGRKTPPTPGCRALHTLTEKGVGKTW